MNIGVTGASGVLGKILCDKLNSTSDELFKFQGDLTSQSEVDSWLENCKPDVLFHFGALVAVDIVKKEPFRAYEVNVGGTINLLASVKKLNIKPWIFYASSSHVYKSSEQPIKEEFPTEPINTYGMTKLAGEKVCQSFSDSYNVNICIGRIFSFYHPTQKPPFLYPSMIARLESEDLSKPFKLRGANSVRDIINAEEVIDIIIKLKNKRYAGVVNIAGGSGITIGDFVKKIAAKSIQIEAVDNEKNTLVADISKLMQTLK